MQATVDGSLTKTEADGLYDPLIQHNTTATTDPGASDDSAAGYAVRSAWINTSTGEIWRCIDATAGAAQWVKTTLTLDELGSAATKDVGTASGQVPLIGTKSATTALAGLVELATTAEAEGGTAGVVPDAAGTKAHVDSRLAANGGTIPETDRQRGADTMTVIRQRPDCGDAGTVPIEQRQYGLSPLTTGR